MIDENDTVMREAKKILKLDNMNESDDADHEVAECQCQSTENGVWLSVETAFSLDGDQSHVEDNTLCTESPHQDKSSSVWVCFHLPNHYSWAIRQQQPQTLSETAF